MGFTAEDASDALVESSNDLTAAASYLVNKSQTTDEYQISHDNTLSLSPPPPLLPPPPPVHTQISMNIVNGDMSICEGTSAQEMCGSESGIYSDAHAKGTRKGADNKRGTPLFSKGFNLFGVPKQPSSAATASTGLSTDISNGEM